MPTSGHAPFFRTASKRLKRGALDAYGISSILTPESFWPSRENPVLSYA
jgi:hypothetical protein